MGVLRPFSNPFRFIGWALNGVCWKKKQKLLFSQFFCSTWGASSGIGKAVAIEAVREGAKVILSARRENLLEKIKEEELLTLTKSENVKILPLDLGELETLKAKGRSGTSFLIVFLSISPFPTYTHFFFMRASLF